MMQPPLRFEASGVGVQGGVAVEPSGLDWNEDSVGGELSCSGGRRRLSGLCHLAQGRPGLMDTCFDWCNYTKQCVGSVSTNTHAEWAQLCVLVINFWGILFKAKPYPSLRALLFTDCSLRHNSLQYFSPRHKQTHYFSDFYCSILRLLLLFMTICSLFLHTVLLSDLFIWNSVNPVMIKMHPYKSSCLTAWLVIKWVNVSYGWM